MALPVGEFLALEHGTEFWGVDRAELQARPRLPGTAALVHACRHGMSRMQSPAAVREAVQAWESHSPPCAAAALVW